MYNRKSKLLIRKKLKSGMITSMLLLIPLLGDAIFTFYLLSLCKLLRSEKLIKRARLSVGGVGGVFLSLALSILFSIEYSFIGALIFFALTFMVVYLAFRILVASILVELGDIFRVETLRYGGYLFPFLPFLGIFSLVGVILLAIGFHDASKSKLKYLIKNKKF